MAATTAAKIHNVYDRLRMDLKPKTPIAMVTQAKMVRGPVRAGRIRKLRIMPLRRAMTPVINKILYILTEIRSI